MLPVRFTPRCGFVSQQLEADPCAAHPAPEPTRDPRQVRNGTLGRSTGDWYWGRALLCATCQCAQPLHSHRLSGQGRGSVVGLCPVLACPRWCLVVGARLASHAYQQPPCAVLGGKRLCPLAKRCQGVEQPRARIQPLLLSHSPASVGSHGPRGGSLGRDLCPPFSVWQLRAWAAGPFRVTAPLQGLPRAPD